MTDFDPGKLHPLLADLDAGLGSAPAFEDRIRPLLDLLSTVTGLGSTWLTTVDDAIDIQRVLYAYNPEALKMAEGMALPWSDSPCRRAQQERSASSEDAPSAWQHDNDEALVLGIATFASTPVHTADGKLFGTLCAASNERVPMPANADRVLKLLGQLVTQYCERETLTTRLREASKKFAAQALTDRLTGLPNRRALEQELTRMLARRHREGQRLLVAFIDLDGFKTINDRHGHDIGDDLLVAVGQGLADTLRAGDLVARYGGDEFVVVAPAPAEGAERHAIEFQQLLSVRTQVQVPLHDSASQRDDDDAMLDYRGASVGMVITQVGELDADAVITRADAAMYRVKQARNVSR